MAGTLEFLCIKCRNKLTAVEGCVFCDDFKKKYLTIEGDAPQLKVSTVGQTALDIIMRELKKLGKLCMESDEFNPELNKQLSIMTKSVTLLMDGVRKVKDSEKENEEVTYSEQVELMIEWLNDLPFNLKTAAVEKITKAACPN